MSKAPHKMLCFLLLITGTCFFSCEKYLDLKPSSEVVVPSTLKDVQAILDASRPLNFMSPTIGEASADDYFVPLDNYRNLDQMVQKRYIWDYSDPQTYHYADWQNIYYGIYLCNAALETLSKIEINTVNQIEWKRLEAMAKVYRSNILLRGAWVYAKAYEEGNAANDLGMVLRNTTDITVSSVRYSVKETYDFILKDLLSAVPHLPERQQLAVRPSKAAAYGLLSRTYLSMRNYKEAGLYADSCLNLQNSLMDFNTDITIPNATSDQNPFNIFDKEVVFSTAISLYSLYSIATGYGCIDTMLYNSYSDNDLRKQAFFRDLGKYVEMRGNFSVSNTIFFTGISTAEMWLTRAECEARQGKVNEAIADINHLLKHRYAKNTFQLYEATDKNMVLQLVLSERRKELVMRDLRWMDIKRLNIEGADIVLRRVVEGKSYELKPNDPKYAAPIPHDIILESSIPQNPY